MERFIKVKMTLNESVELIRIAVSDISYYRKWHTKGSQNNTEQCVIYLKSRKDIICNHSADEIDLLISKSY